MTWLVGIASQKRGREDGLAAWDNLKFAMSKELKRVTTWGVLEKGQLGSRSGVRHLPI